MNAQQTPPASGGDTGKSQLAFLAKLSVAIVCVGMIWLLKTLTDAAFVLATDDITKVDWRATARWTMMSVGVLLVIAGSWNWGARKGLWSPLPKFRKSGGDSGYSAGRGEARFSLGAVIWGFVGLALATLLGLLAWREFEFGLSNAPERMALRGYVPRESVAAALTAAAPALPEIHVVIAPPLGADGTTNSWSQSVKRLADHYTYFSEPDGMAVWLEQKADGRTGPYSLEMKASEYQFRSRTNSAITIKWWQSKRKLTPQEVAELEGK